MSPTKTVYNRGISLHAAPTNEDYLRILRMVEWEGYDTSAGERTCPICGAWAYQQGHPPRHAYRCALAVLLGNKTEGE